MLTNDVNRILVCSRLALASVERHSSGIQSLDSTVEFRQDSRTADTIRLVGSCSTYSVLTLHNRMSSRMSSVEDVLVRSFISHNLSII